MKAFRIVSEQPRPRLLIFQSIQIIPDEALISNLVLLWTLATKTSVLHLFPKALGLDFFSSTLNLKDLVLMKLELFTLEEEVWDLFKLDSNREIWIEGIELDLNLEACLSLFKLLCCSVWAWESEEWTSVGFKVTPWIWGCSSSTLAWGSPTLSVRWSNSFSNFKYASKSSKLQWWRKLVKEISSRGASLKEPLTLRLRDQREARGELDESRMYALFSEVLLTSEFSSMAIEVQWLCGRSRNERDCKSGWVVSRRCRLETHPIVCFWFNSRRSSLFQRTEVIFRIQDKRWMKKSIGASLEVKLCYEVENDLLSKPSNSSKNSSSSFFFFSSSFFFSSFWIFKKSLMEGRPSFFLLLSKKLVMDRTGSSTKAASSARSEGDGWWDYQKERSQRLIRIKEHRVSPTKVDGRIRKLTTAKYASSWSDCNSEKQPTLDSWGRFWDAFPVIIEVAMLEICFVGKMRWKWCVARKVKGTAFLLLVWKHEVVQAILSLNSLILYNSLGGFYSHVEISWVEAVFENQQLHSPFQIS